MKQQLREVARGRPGERFRRYYEHAKRDRNSGAAKERIVRIVLATVCFAIGLVLVFIPGPAILFFFIGGVLLASESLFAARALDWAEVKARAAWDWGARRWRRMRGGRKRPRA